MKLSEYLKIRPSKAKALTTKEINMIGITDYSSGWPIRYAEVEVPQQLVDMMLSGNFLPLYARKKKTMEKYKGWKPPVLKNNTAPDSSEAVYQLIGD